MIDSPINTDRNRLAKIQSLFTRKRTVWAAVRVCLSAFVRHAETAENLPPLKLIDWTVRNQGDHSGRSDPWEVIETPGNCRWVPFWLKICSLVIIICLMYSKMYCGRRSGLIVWWCSQESNSYLFRSTHSSSFCTNPVRFSAA